MDTLFPVISGLVSMTIEWMGDWIDAITSEPILLLFICMPLVGIGIGAIKRLISL